MSPEEAELYALVHDGAPGDVEFYRQRTEGAERVLELGCGWGRVARELSAREVVGLESDEGALALAHVRGVPSHVRLVQGDMRDFEVDGLFDRVIVPFTGIYCLLSEPDLVLCFESVGRALAPGGEFIFDAYHADPFHEESRPDDYPDDLMELVAEVDHREERLLVYERSTWDRDAQRMDATYVYLEEKTEEPRAMITIGHRYLLSAQVEPLLHRAGLKVDSMLGGFDARPFEAGSGSMVVVASRRS